jgi:hypothetical protein
VTGPAHRLGEAKHLTGPLLSLLSFLCIAAVLIHSGSTPKPASETISFLTAIAGVLSIHLGHSSADWKST